ncbi:HAMP domain-containing methyl-accepting chemotaxis protein [Bacillus sp. B190/17]|uniref:HAMP domain-containing methyl-accepting chemotaxis protein n=2 Tax=Bacillus lumedeiriae TaxID=3058829 RepID=A0ABW8I485_9BACI
MGFSIAKKLYSSFISILLILFIIGAVGYFAAMRLHNEYTFLLDDRVKKVDMINELIAIQKDVTINSLSYFIFNEQSNLDRIKDDQRQFMDVHHRLEQMTTQPQNKQLLREIEEASGRYHVLVPKIFESKAQGLDWSGYASEANEQEEIMKVKAEELKQVQVAQLNKTRATLNNLVVSTRMFLIALGAAAVIVGGVIAYVIGRSITVRVNKTTAALKEVAAGNLQVEKLQVGSSDEIGEMGISFNQMLDDLRSILSKVNESALQLSAQSQQLSASAEQSTASSQMVAGAAEENMNGSSMQLELVNESVASMEEMAAGIGQIAKSNEEMLHSAEEVESLVVKGAQSINSVSSQINEIHLSIKEAEEYMGILEQHATQIQRVTGLITDISEQTNLLALNAAIEAARAGEHGKGFAVVAEEVRKLAEQSKSSAAEIEEMVKNIQTDTNMAASSIQTGSSKVEQGLSASQTSLEVFETIKTSVTDVGSKVETVSAAIEELQAMTENVSQSAAEVKRIAEKTAATAHDSSAATEEQLAAIEQISASTQSLASLAVELQSEANKFRI